jgi:hypothetical protein
MNPVTLKVAESYKHLGQYDCLPVVIRLSNHNPNGALTLIVLTKGHPRFSIFIFNTTSEKIFRKWKHVRN